jgi:O-antigen ligase
MPTIIFRFLIVAGFAYLSSFFFSKLIADNLLWSVYFFFFLIFGLVFSLTPFKQRILISLFVITIPINIYKVFGTFILDSRHDLIWQSGLKSLGYFSINEGLIYLLVSVSLIVSIIHRDKLLKLKTDNIFKFLLLSIFISVLVSYDPHGFGYKAIRQGIYYFLIYYYFSRQFSMKENLWDLFYCLSFILGFEISICIFQMVHITMPFLNIIGGSSNQLQGFNTAILERLSGSLGHPNGFSSFMVMLLPMVFSSGIFFKGRKQFIAAFLFLVGVTMVFFSLSRSGWIALIAEVFVFLVFGKHILPNWFINKFMWLIGIALFTAFIGINWDSIYFRFYSDESRDAAFSRITQSKVAWYYIKNNLFFGIGDGNYLVNLKAVERLLYVTSPGSIVHNIYLKVFAERGLVGIIAYLGVYFVIIRHLIKIIKLKHVYSVVALGLLGASIGHMIQNLFELAETVETISIFLFFIFGVACSIKVDDGNLYMDKGLHGRL